MAVYWKATVTAVSAAVTLSVSKTVFDEYVARRAKRLETLHKIWERQLASLNLGERYPDAEKGAVVLSRLDNDVLSHIHLLTGVGERYIEEVLSPRCLTRYIAPWTTDRGHFENAVRVLLWCAPISADFYLRRIVGHPGLRDIYNWAEIIETLDDEEKYRHFEQFGSAPIRDPRPYCRLIDFMVSAPPKPYGPSISTLCDAVFERRPQKSADSRVGALLTLRERSRVQELDS